MTSALPARPARGSEPPAPTIKEDDMTAPDATFTTRQPGRFRTAGAGAGQPPPGRLWTHQETADFLGIPPATLHQLNYKGTAPRSFKVGRHRRYDPRDVWAWLAGRASDRR